jgi:hypothetical protein
MRGNEATASPARRRSLDRGMLAPTYRSTGSVSVNVEPASIPEFTSSEPP